MDWLVALLILGQETPHGPGLQQQWPRMLSCLLISSSHGRRIKAKELRRGRKPSDVLACVSIWLCNDNGNGVTGILA